MHGINLSDLHIKNELVKGNKEIHLANIRNKTGLNYQIINLANGGYKLEVKDE